ncbi:unnamed protein product [Paramecium primaurelia]|uniref:Uncharacterized protein n=1 Tax=Paramecium primaurelia TaxID=5886 RepID=A0A8S1ME68_PARPR|nr:unnamed protein product [Paramecium primaurelia]
MISSHVLCQEHPNQKIQGIYIQKQKESGFFKKVCSECITNFQIPSKQILSNTNLVIEIQRMFDRQKCCFDLSETEQILKEVLEKIEQLKVEITIIFSTIRDSILSILNSQKQGDGMFHDIIYNKLDLFQCSQMELDFLYSFFEEKNYEIWMKRKKNIAQEIQKAGVFLERFIKNAYKTSQLVELISTNQKNYLQQSSTKTSTKNKIIQLEGLQEVNNQLIQTNCHLIIQQNGNKIYNYNEQILRQEKNKLGQKNDLVFNNLEQIKFLQFKGEYGVNGYKINQWNYFWNDVLVGGGMYNHMGQKIGQWIDLHEDYQENKKIIEKGCYNQDQRRGVWQFYQDQYYIGGGSYSEDGLSMKIGKWIELSDGFQKKSNITYIGEYKKGKKVNKWETWFQNQIQEKILIGGGSYDERGDVIKIGQWIELNKDFTYDFQLIHQGEYKNGKKVGIWITKLDGSYIGGGSYDERGDCIKIGKWVELSAKFCSLSKVTFKGEYENGKKIGRWDTALSGIEIGGGSYDKEGQQIKIGKWIELNDELCSEFYVTYNGEYKNDQKVGKWNINIQHIKDKWNECIGDGLYDQKGDGIKIGKWIELCDGFNQQKQITYKGNYQNGVKVGKWVIFFNQKLRNNEKKKIGGGFYDEKVNGMKIGKWVELCNGFNQQKQITFKGNYQNGVKVGKWNLYFYVKQGDNEKKKKMQYIYVTKHQVEMYYMMIKEMVLKLENGLKFWINLIRLNKQFLKVSIKMKKKLEDGILLNQIIRQIKFVQVVDHMMKEVMVLRLEIGLNWTMTFINIRILSIQEIIRMVQRLVFG